MSTFIVASVLIIIVAIIIKNMIKDSKSGNSCHGGCSSCPKNKDSSDKECNCH